MKKGKFGHDKMWELVESRRKAVKEGMHFILHPIGDPKLTSEEKKELLSIAFDLANEYAVQPGRYRIALNGPGQATQATFHIHLIFPAGSDELPRIVSSIEDIINKYKG